MLVGSTENAQFQKIAETRIDSICKFKRHQIWKQIFKQIW